MQHTNKKLVWGLLIAIVISAFAVRFIGIDTLPAGLYPDEAVNGTDTLTANATHEYKLFYEANNGREGLFINLQALSVLLFGNTIFALKLWSIIFGTLTVAGIYFLTNEMIRNRAVALTATFMTAFSYWAINFSRIGFRAIMVPFILTWAFYFIFRGLRTKHLGDFIIAGLIYGLGLHTYIAFRVSPLALIILLLALAVVRKQFFKTYWKHVTVFAVTMFIASAPMLLDFFVTHPEHYASRTGSISVLNPEVNQGQLVPIVTKTLGLSVAKYFLWGDQNMRHNYAPYPLLNPIAAATFFIGLIAITIRFFHLLWLRFRRGVRDDKLTVYAFLLAWFFALLIPEFLANEGNPHALRAIGTIPVVMIIAALPFAWAFGKLCAIGRGGKIAIVSMLAASFIFMATYDTVKYFYFFANSVKQHQAFEANLTQEARYINSLPDATEKFVVSQSMQRVPIAFLCAHKSNISYYYPGEIDQIKPRNPETMVVLMHDKMDDVIAKLTERFPYLQLETITNSFGDTFYILKHK